MRMDQKYILPGYIPPEKDELLSCWIFRLARSHKMKPYSFTKFCFNQPSLWNRDIDKYYNSSFINLLSSLSPLSISQINNLHLISYKDIVFNSITNLAYTEGILSLGIVHRNRKNYGLLACPLCLTKKEYYKKSWRLLSSVVCTDCNCNLIEKCHNCKSPIVFQRLDIGKKDVYSEVPIYFCWKCHFDLRSHFTLVDENSLVVQYQKFIDSTISNGYNNITQYSFQYFTVLFSLLRKSRSKSKNSRILEAFANEFGINSSEFCTHSSELSIELRAEILPLIFFLLSDLNTFFIPFCKKYSIRFSDVRSDNTTPFWVYESFRI